MPSVLGVLIGEESPCKCQSWGRGKWSVRGRALRLAYKFRKDYFQVLYKFAVSGAIFVEHSHSIIVIGESYKAQTSPASLKRVMAFLFKIPGHRKSPVRQQKKAGYFTWRLLYATTFSYLEMMPQRRSHYYDGVQANVSCSHLRIAIKMTYAHSQRKTLCFIQIKQNSFHLQFMYRIWTKIADPAFTEKATFLRD